MKRTHVRKNASELDALVPKLPGGDPTVDSFSLGSPIDSLSLSSLGAYMLFDEISSESVRPACEFIIKANYVFDKKQPLTLLLNTPGGSLYDGFALVDTILSSRLAIHTVAIGHVCSMGSIIFTAGTPGHRVMAPNSYMMLHQFSDIGEGKYHEFVAHRAHQDDIHKRLIKHLLKTTKLKERQIKDFFLGKDDVWLTAVQALKFGLCDEIKTPWR